MKITIDNDVRERWNGVERASKEQGKRSVKHALQWRRRLKASRYNWEMSGVVDEDGMEVTGQHGYTGKYYHSEIRARDGKPFGTSNLGAEKVKVPPKSSPGQIRSREIPQTSRKVGKR